VILKSPKEKQHQQPITTMKHPSLFRSANSRSSGKFLRQTALGAIALGGALAVQPELVVEAVRGALRGIVERERVTVLVHPEDLEMVRDAMDDVRASLGGIEHCEVQAERRVSRGGAVVRTPDGDVDARVEIKLARAREVVETALGKS
jgi:flagellar biosynthesis/type III secretory pathway protein FliH